MKHWKKRKDEDSKAISLGKEILQSIIEVSIAQDGVTFKEECDYFFEKTYTKEQALEVVDELREWILKEAE